MKIYESVQNLPETARGAVLAIGNFDGVHRGHQELLEKARKEAGILNVPFGVLTFEPHPHVLFQPDEPPNRITPVSLKRRRLEESGVEVLFSLPFDWNFASQSAEDFIQKILIEGIGAVHVVVGDDFRFGQLRKGKPEDIEKAGIPLTVVSKVSGKNEEIFSSSKIRQLLRCGDVAGANEILGWEWEMRGVVGAGDQRGRKFGFPTANIPIGDTIHPAYGVYASWVQIEGEEIWRPAATNIGIRPMFKIHMAQIESFILDFEADLYGKTLRVKPVRYLRGEAKFSTLEELVEQIKRDCDDVRAILKGR